MASVRTTHDLARFNSEVSRGIVHTAAYEAEMAVLQEAFSGPGTPAPAQRTLRPDGSISELATYNKEVSDGIVHTAGWDAQMSVAQARFDADHGRAPSQQGRRRQYHHGPATVSELAYYNASVSSGVVYTPEAAERMSVAQAAFNAARAQSHQTRLSRPRIADRVRAFVGLD